MDLQYRVKEGSILYLCNRGSQEPLNMEKVTINSNELPRTTYHHRLTIFLTWHTTNKIGSKMATEGKIQGKKQQHGGLYVENSGGFVNLGRRSPTNHEWPVENVTKIKWRFSSTKICQSLILRLGQGKGRWADSFGNEEGGEKAAEGKEREGG